MIAGVWWFILRRQLASMWLGYFAAGIAGSALPDAKFISNLPVPTAFASIFQRAGDSFHDLFHAGASNVSVGKAAEVGVTLGAPRGGRRYEQVRQNERAAERPNGSRTPTLRTRREMVLSA